MPFLAWLVGTFAQTNVLLAFYAIVVHVNFEETANPLKSSDLIFFRPLELSSIKSLLEIDECFGNQISTSCPREDERGMLSEWAWSMSQDEIINKWSDEEE